MHRTDCAAPRLENRQAKLHNPRVFDWNDIRYFLAVARHGSTLAASKAMRVSQSTVHRRLEELENRIGRRLMNRHPSGYRLTELGHAMRAEAERVEEAVAGFERRVAASDKELSGTVRLTCPEALGSRLMRSSFFDAFNARHPGLRVELVMSSKFVDLAKGNADVAIRAAPPSDETLFGRKIGDSPWAIYASHSYVARHGSPRRLEDLNNHAVVRFDGDMSEHQSVRWLQSVAPGAYVAAHGNSLSALMLAVKSGAGVAALPTVVGDGDDEIVQVLGPITDLATPYYLLMHQDMKNTPRVRALFDFIIKELDAILPILSGGTRERTSVEAVRR